MMMAVAALAVSMVLPVMRSVNLSAGKPATIDRTLTADGWPLPPGPPRTDATLVADGWPLPPGPPRTDETLVADGWPLPQGPPPFHQPQVIVLEFANAAAPLTHR